MQLDGVWRINGMAVDLVNPPGAQAAATTAPAQEPAKPAAPPPKTTAKKPAKPQG